PTTSPERSARTRSWSRTRPIIRARTARAAAAAAAGAAARVTARITSSDRFARPLCLVVSGQGGIFHSAGRFAAATASPWAYVFRPSSPRAHTDCHFRAISPLENKDILMNRVLMKTEIIGIAALASICVVACAGETVPADGEQ